MPAPGAPQNPLSPGYAPPIQTAGTPYQGPNQWSLQGGFDISGPGAAEDAYGRYGQQLATPGYAEQFAQQASLPQARAGTATAAYTQQYNPMAGPSRVDTYAQGNQPLGGQGAAERYASDQGAYQRAGDATASGQYWQSLQGQQNVPKDMGAYYDRAREKGSAQIDRATAARGQFNSSAALDQQREFSADMGAAQAKAEADYALQSADLNNRIRSGAAGQADNAAAQRFGAGLNAAQASDNTGLSRFNAGLNAAQAGDQLGIGRYTAGLAGAGQTDSQGIGALTAGLNVASTADNSLQGRLSQLGQGAASADASRRGRVGSMFDSLGTLTSGVGGAVAGGYGDLLAADQGMFDMGQQLSLGAGLATLGGIKESNALGAAAANAGANSAAGASQDIQTILTQLKGNQAAAK